MGRRDDTGRRCLCPADSSKYSGATDPSGSCSHHSESRHNGEDSGEENGNGGEERGGCPGAHHANTKVQLRTGNEHRDGPWRQPEKAVGGGGLESGIAGLEGRYVRGQDASDGKEGDGSPYQMAARG